MHCHIYTATPTVACLPIIVPLRTATVELTKLGFLRPTGPTPANWVRKLTQLNIKSPFMTQQLFQHFFFTQFDYLHVLKYAYIWFDCIIWISSLHYL